ncbi:hypothetical protein CFP56_001306 [Quercus suber]|uniref:Uncharacterized protein n=1 Tax=Quercus suber TaxID=58331 RepID=A0AAW0LH54_QUESU
MDGSLLNCPLVLKVPKETFVGSFGLWLYISHVMFTEHFDEGSCISSLIRPKRLDIQIKMCGARILYEQDMLEFVQNSRQENFKSCDDLSRGCEKFIEDHMSSSQSYDLKLKQKLNSLLSTLYQVSSSISRKRLDPDTMRMLLPNNETIQEECTSRETFSNQAFRKIQVEALLI